MKHEKRDVDPEVLADLALRIRTEQERKAMPVEAYDKLVVKMRPAFVAAWKCRKCEALVSVQESDMENLATFNAQLRARGEAPLDHNAIMFCDACRAKYTSGPFKAARSDERRDRVTHMAELIRKVKGSSNPDGERVTLRQLRDMGHPDVDGLLSAIRERGGGKRGRGQDASLYTRRTGEGES